MSVSNASTPIPETPVSSEVTTPTRESVSEDQEGLENLSQEDLIKMLHKREKIALRYKTRFTEVRELLLLL